MINSFFHFVNHFQLITVEEVWLADIIKICIYFVIAAFFMFIAEWLSRKLIKIMKFSGRSNQAREGRLHTLHGLLKSLIQFLAFLIALIASFGLFVKADTLVWLVGLFSAAFSLSARPVISDVMTGVGFLFEDTFSVGEKVEILGMEGVVEEINLRSTLMRSSTGELFVIPNGEIRTIRNFSRGRFSPANITLKISIDDLNKAMAVLESLSQEALEVLPNLVEDIHIISGSETVSQNVELTILAKAKFGKAAEMKPRLQALISEKLSENGIKLVN